MSLRRSPPKPPDVEGHLLGRAAEIGRVLARHGLADMRARGGSPREVRLARARRLRDALEELGPTFAKIGQILSTRPDLLPREFIEELSDLQENVEPLTESQVVSVMEAELGVPWEDVFETIEPTPLAAGTIGQVHRATLETGARVVVKVQRPDAGRDIYRDLGLLERFGEKATDRAGFRQLIDAPAVIEHLSNSLRRELDFSGEAANLDRMRDVLEPYNRLAVPGVYGELSSARLLVMEEVEGIPVLEAPDGPERSEAARQLLESYYRQILTEGFFHADPHPGNLKWWNERIYFLDFGMVGEVDARTRELLVVMLMAFAHGDSGFLTDLMLMLGGDERSTSIDLPRLQVEMDALVSRYSGLPLKDLQLGPILQSMTEVAARNDVRLPSSLMLIGKALAQMQLAAAELDPTLDPFALVSSYVTDQIGDQLRSRLKPERLAYDGQKLLLRGTRLAESVERLAGSRPGSKLQIELTGTNPLERTIRNAARRIALAVTAGACIVATGFTADVAAVDRWVPITLGTVGAVLAGGLLIDLLLRRPG